MLFYIIYVYFLNVIFTQLYTNTRLYYAKKKLIYIVINVI